jgi:hypothetical protein
MHAFIGLKSYSPFGFHALIICILPQTPIIFKHLPNKYLKNLNKVSTLSFIIKNRL